MSRKNTSKVVWKTDLHGRAVVDALKDMLTDDGYLIRAKRLAELMTSKRSTPQERLLDAVEYTGKFGRIHDIDVVGFELGYMEYFSIDVIIMWIFLISFIHILAWYPEKIVSTFSRVVYK